MGNDFIRCELQTKNMVCLIFVILASLLLLQYLELPHRGTIFSLSNSRKDNKKMSIPNFEYKNTSEIVEISVSVAPKGSSDESDISPALSSFTEENEVAPSPSIRSSDSLLSSRKNDTLLVMAGRTGLVAPVVSPSQSGIPRNTDLISPGNGNGTSWKSKHEEGPPPDIKPKSPSVVSISEMNDMLIHFRDTAYSKIPLWASDADQELVEARFEIEHSPIIKDHQGLHEAVFRNLSLFLRSYEVMEKKLKIYIYKEGKGPVFRHPRLKGIYASEGWFMKQLQASNRFLTSDPGRAHLFYFPFSSQLLVDFVYVDDSHTFHEINEYLKNYINTIKTRYTFWNRTDDGDHFLVACHDWAPIETRELMSNCIRALCNSDVKEGFQFGKDVALPETYVHSPQNPSRERGGGGAPPSKRKILAFFAGQMHGYVRPILLRHWQNKDPSMKIFGKMRKGYEWHMKNSKYCICAKGYEVNSPRVVEAIVYGCVPVIISDGFVPPFFGVLKWESFAVFVLEKDIPRLKDVLESIPERRYVLLQRRGKMVRRHFIWHADKPLKFDIFHMILHSIWYNRVLQMAPKLF